MLSTTNWLQLVSSWSNHRLKHDGCSDSDTTNTRRLVPVCCSMFVSGRCRSVEGFCLPTLARSGVWCLFPPAGFLLTLLWSSDCVTTLIKVSSPRKMLTASVCWPDLREQSVFHLRHARDEAPDQILINEVWTEAREEAQNSRRLSSLDRDWCHLELIPMWWSELGTKKFP